MTYSSFHEDDQLIEFIDLTQTQAREPEVPGEVRQLRDRLHEELRARWAAEAKVLSGPAVARLTGRLARVDGQDGSSKVTLCLAVADEHGHQTIRLQADAEDLKNTWAGAELTVTALWKRGRLTLDGIEAIREVTEAMPTIAIAEKPKPPVVPDWFDSKAANAKRELFKSSDGSSSVSDLKVHIVFATKRRGQVLTTDMVDRLKPLVAEVVEAKGLGKLLAVNGEADHVHIALWLPVSVAASEAAGLIKSYTARFLRREFPELRGHDEDALWQRGCFVGAIGNGGDLGAVLDYIANQDSPGE